MIFEDSVREQQVNYILHTLGADLDCYDFVPRPPRKGWHKVWGWISDRIFYLQVAIARAQDWYINARGGL